MYVDDLEVGGLYTTENYRSDAIELFSNYHHRYEADNMYSEEFLLQHEYFVLLEVKGDFSQCLKIITQSGVVGWTTYLHRNRRYELTKFRSLTEKL